MSTSALARVDQAQIFISADGGATWTPWDGVVTGGSGGTASTDGASFTANSSQGTPAMGAYQSTPGAVTDGDLAVLGMTAQRTLKVTLFDSSGNEQAAGGGTQYTEDAAAAANPVGNMLIVRRRDTLSGTEVSADSDNIAVNATAKGEVYVKQTDAVPITDNSGSLTVDGTVAATQSGTWNVTNVSGTVSLPTGAATAAKQPALGTAGAASADVITVQGVASMTPLLVNASATTQPISAASLPLPTGASTAAKQPALGTAGTASADVISIQGIASMTPLQVADNGGSLTVDNAALAVVGGGAEATALRVTIASDSTGVLSVDDNGGSLTVDGTVAATQSGTWNIGSVTTLPNVTLAAGTNTNEVVGDAAHDAAIAGNPVRVAGRGLSADYTAVATGDTADLIASLLGKQVVLPYALPAAGWSYAAASGGITNTTGVTAKAAAGAGIRNYITRVQIINGHATVDTDVQIRDGASGTVLWRGFAKAAGGGVSAEFDPPLRGTANTLVEVACGTTGSATYFNLQGFTAAE